MLWLIVNPSAGDGRTGSRLGQITAELHALGLEHVVRVSDSLEHARELAHRAREAGALPVSFGGDGLVGAVAGALAHTGTPMGVLPGGRGNDIARELGIPADPRRACAVLLHGVDRTLDLGRVGGPPGAPFLGIVSCGFDSEANRIANASRWVRGSLAYSYGGLRALATWRPATFSLTVDGTCRSVQGYTVAVANSRAYGGGMLMAPAAELDDGRLDIVVIESMSKLRFLANMPRIFTGSHLSVPGVSVLRGAEVEISADRPLSVYGDGERICELPARIRVDSAAVRMRVPARP